MALSGRWHPKGRKYLCDKISINSPSIVNAFTKTHLTDEKSTRWVFEKYLVALGDCW